LQGIEGTLKYIEENFLSNSNYIGGDNVTLADLSAACEIIGLNAVDFDLTPYPKVFAWLKRMHELPEVKETHKLFWEGMDKFGKKVLL